MEEEVFLGRAAHALDWSQGGGLMLAGATIYMIQCTLSCAGPEAPFRGLGKGEFVKAHLMHKKNQI